MAGEPREAAAGVYFRTGDYAGLWRRLLIDAIDFPVVVALSALVLALAGAVGAPLENGGGLVLALLVLVWLG
ncbi:MAG TPA: hypothetical protein VF310_17235, partial [Vicinamibacteria bacterium]